MSQSVIYQYLTAGSFAVTVPSGYSNQVLVYAWGAGGGTGFNGPLGGGGGYAAGVVNINAGDSVIISVGGTGGGSGGELTTQTYQRTITRTIIRSTVTVGISTTTETKTILAGETLPPVPLGTSGDYSYGPWILVSTTSTATGSSDGGAGSTPYISFSGGASGVSTPQGGDDNYIGAGGGGGGASAVFVNAIPMLVAAGGGGGGGGSNYQTGTVGTAGGVATAVNSTSRGATSVANYATGGGGGGGYPKGGAAGTSVSDDAGRPSGGYGGQNYANASVTSTSLLAGSGINTAGTNNGYYPGKKLGTAGYDGCVILVFQKLFTVSIKQSGYWKQVTNAYVKTPDKTVTTYSTVVVPSGTSTTITERKIANTVGTTKWKVPYGVTTLNITAAGAGGGDGSLYFSGGSGSGGQQINCSLSVTPGQELTLNVGSAGETPTVTITPGSVTVLWRSTSTGGGGGTDPSGLYNGYPGVVASTTGATTTTTATNVTAYPTNLSALQSYADRVVAGGSAAIDPNENIWYTISPPFTQSILAGTVIYNNSIFVAHNGVDTGAYASSSIATTITVGSITYTRGSLAYSGTITADLTRYGLGVITATVGAYNYTINTPFTTSTRTISGVGGGGGAATSILLDGSTVLVAPGGAGGVGSSVVAASGGLGGGTAIIPVGSSLTTAGNAKGIGYINISYDLVTTSPTPTTTSVPTVRTVAAGGWKQIVRGWLKQNGVWKNISTPLTLTSSKVSSAPSRRAVINLVIASNTSSYNLIDTLNTLGTYYPGYSDITLTINVGVTINSNDSGGAALTIDGLTSGDSLIVVNNGTILGRGGYGGAAGYVSTVTVGSGKNSTTTNSPQPGGYGGAGGTALAVTYATTLENNGVIYAGGGGGGGGGISFNSTGGGQGGGGAGYGPGANAGTLTAGGAGGSNGGAGGSNGANGTAGTTGANYTYSTNNKGGVTTVAGSAGGSGGIGGKAITGYAKITVTVAGTIVGPTA